MVALAFLQCFKVEHIQVYKENVRVQKQYKISFPNALNYPITYMSIHTSIINYNDNRDLKLHLIITYIVYIIKGYSWLMTLMYLLTKKEYTIIKWLNVIFQVRCSSHILILLFKIVVYNPCISWTNIDVHVNEIRE